jgi:hypothetical protein
MDEMSEEEATPTKEAMSDGTPSFGPSTPNKESLPPAGQRPLLTGRKEARDALRTLRAESTLKKFKDFSVDLNNALAQNEARLLKTRFHLSNLAFGKALGRSLGPENEDVLVSQYLTFHPI